MSARARRFLVWRAGTSVNWDCSVQDIADEVGLSPQTVSSIMKRRGWKCLEKGRGRDPYAYVHLATSNPRHLPLLRELGVDL